MSGGALPPRATTNKAGRGAMREQPLKKWGAASVGHGGGAVRRRIKRIPGCERRVNRAPPGGGRES